MNRRTFLGLGFLVAFLIVTALVFSKVTESIDTQVAVLVNNSQLGAVGTELMILVTQYGREIVWGFVVLVTLLFGTRNTKLLAIELASLFLAGFLIGDLAKIVLSRPRPFLAGISSINLRVPAEFDSSYPSGHALIVSIGATFCLAKFRRKTLAALLAVEAAFVCASRVYVGLHYPLDVIGGILLGTAVALVGIAIIEEYLGRYLAQVSNLAVRILKEGPLDL